MEIEKTLTDEENNSSDGKLTINAGGTTFCTNWHSILTTPSYFLGLARNKQQNYADSLTDVMDTSSLPTEIFVDCDANLFQYILFRLRRGRWWLPDTVDPDALADEAEHLSIDATELRQVAAERREAAEAEAKRDTELQKELKELKEEMKKKEEHESTIKTELERMKSAVFSLENTLERTGGNLKKHQQKSFVYYDSDDDDDDDKYSGCTPICGPKNCAPHYNPLGSCGGQRNVCKPYKSSCKSKPKEKSCCCADNKQSRRGKKWDSDSD